MKSPEIIPCQTIGLQSVQSEIPVKDGNRLPAFMLFRYGNSTPSHLYGFMQLAIPLPFDSPDHLDVFD